jgi:hypothetical protein
MGDVVYEGQDPLRRAPREVECARANKKDLIPSARFHCGLAVTTKRRSLDDFPLEVLLTVCYKQ